MGLDYRLPMPFPSLPPLAVVLSSPRCRRASRRRGGGVIWGGSLGFLLLSIIIIIIIILTTAAAAGCGGGSGRFLLARTVCSDYGALRPSPAPIACVFSQKPLRRWRRWR